MKPSTGWLVVLVLVAACAYIALVIPGPERPYVEIVSGEALIKWGDFRYRLTKGEQFLGLCPGDTTCSARVRLPDGTIRFQRPEPRATTP